MDMVSHLSKVERDCFVLNKPVNIKFFLKCLDRAELEIYTWELSVGFEVMRLDEILCQGSPGPLSGSVIF